MQLQGQHGRIRGARVVQVEENQAHPLLLLKTQQLHLQHEQVECRPARTNQQRYPYPTNLAVLLPPIPQVTITTPVPGARPTPVVPRLNHSYRICHPYTRPLDARRVVVKVQVQELVRQARVVPLQEVVVWARLVVKRVAVVQQLRVSRPTRIGGVRAVPKVVEIVA